MKSLSILTAAVVVAAMATAVNAQTIRSYTVNYTENPPSIDGVLDAGEWDDAEPATGDFTLLREPENTPSPENLTWRALWDENNLYILIQTDFSGHTGVEFPEDTKSPSALEETLEIFLYPNRNDTPNVVGTELNSYQLIIPLVPGGTTVREAGEDAPPYIVPLARYNANFGDNVDGGWWPEVAIGRTVADGDSVIEYQIAWSEFNAVIGSDETSMNIAGIHPAENDVWQFNISRISSAAAPNNLPVWNWHPGQFFAEGPRGEIVFDGGPPPPTAAENFDLYE